LTKPALLGRSALSWTLTAAQAEPVTAGSILIVGGYGVVGARIAADLAADFPGRVVIAGHDALRARRTAAAIGQGVRGRDVDVTVSDSIAQALSDVTVVVNCVDQPERGLMWAAIASGLGYTDITPHLTDLGRGDGYTRVHSAAQTSGARLVLGAGLVPGISSVMVRMLADALGGADRIDTALLLRADDASGPASLDYLLQELAMTFDVHVNGADRHTRAYTRPVVVDYPAPLGRRMAYLFPFSDQVLYPLTMGARTVHTRLSIDPPALSRLLALLTRTGLARLTARPRIRAAIGRARRNRPGRTDGALALRVDVSHHGRTSHASLVGNGQARATATATAAIVRLLTSGQIAEPGAWMPEQVVDPALFFTRLAQAGLLVTTAGPAASTGC
jgi:saccharopine dehydrogenase-like NADP-dependent oxidoreductase